MTRSPTVETWPELRWTRSHKTTLGDGIALATLAIPAIVWLRRVPAAIQSWGDFLGVWASASGLTAAWALLLLLILASRTRPLSYAYDDAQIRDRHRWLGTAALALTVAHVGLNLLRLDRGDGVWVIPLDELSNSAWLLAAASLAALAATAVTAVHLFRGRNPWEPSFQTHRTAAIAAIAFSLWHEAGAMSSHPTPLLGTWIACHLVAATVYVTARHCSGRFLSHRNELRLGSTPTLLKRTKGGACTWAITIRGNNLERIGPSGLEAPLGYTWLQVQHSDGRWTDPRPLSIRRVLVGSECQLRLIYRTTRTEDSAQVQALPVDAPVRLHGFHGQMTAHHATLTKHKAAVLANGLAVETTLIPLACDLARSANVTVLARLTAWADLTSCGRQELVALSELGVTVIVSVGVRATPLWLGDGNDPTRPRHKHANLTFLEQPATLERLYPNLAGWEFFLAGNDWVHLVADDLRQAGVARAAIHLELHTASAPGA